MQANHAVLSADSTNNVVVARTRPIVLNHVSDLSIIDTEDVLYVSQTGMNNSNSNGFSMVQETLPELQRQLNWEIRPLGRFDVIREEPGFKVKKIQVKPGAVYRRNITTIDVNTGWSLLARPPYNSMRKR